VPHSQISNLDKAQFLVGCYYQSSMSQDVVLELFEPRSVLARCRLTIGHWGSAVSPTAPGGVDQDPGEDRQPKPDRPSKARGKHEDGESCQTPCALAA
jgi:hypothetical protein